VSEAAAARAAPVTECIGTRSSAANHWASALCCGTAPKQTVGTVCEVRDVAAGGEELVTKSRASIYAPTTGKGREAMWTERTGARTGRTGAERSGDEHGLPSSEGLSSEFS